MKKDQEMNDTSRYNNETNEPSILLKLQEIDQELLKKLLDSEDFKTMFEKFNRHPLHVKD